MEVEKIRFTKEQETMLITLYAKALESRSRQPVLSDPWAEQAIGQIDHDFAKFEIGRQEMLTFALRARNFDVQATRFLSKNPCGTVLNLGCGLDSRIYRINPSECVTWYDVDYPGVIDLRRRLYPGRSMYFLVGSPLADLSWLEKVPGDQPAFVMAEGVTMYLTEALLKQILNRIVDHFPGGEIMFDAHSKLIVDMAARSGMTLRGTGASFTWGLDRPQDIIQLEPRLQFVAQFKSSDLPDFPRMPLSSRLRVWSMELLSRFRGLHRPLLYRFPKGRESAQK